MLEELLTVSSKNQTDEMVDTALDADKNLKQAGSTIKNLDEEINWYNDAQKEKLRKTLLSLNDIGKVHSHLKVIAPELNIGLKELQEIKQYLFNSKGIGFFEYNFSAWRRLSKGNATLFDVKFILHESTEIAELKKIQSKTGFDFMGKKFDTMSTKQQKQWEAYSGKYYLQTHSIALEKEYTYFAKKVKELTGGRVDLNLGEIAAADHVRMERQVSHTKIRDNDDVDLHLYIDGKSLENHPSYQQWLKKADTQVTISESLKEKLRLPNNQPTIKELIAQIKGLMLK